MMSPAALGTGFLEISVKGKSIQVPSAVVDCRDVVVVGRVLRMARIHDEEWVEAPPLDDVAAFLTALGRTALRADIFTFTQPLETANLGLLPFRAEPYDLAVVPLTTFAAWWENLPQESRKNTRKAEKKGVVARVASFDDEFVRGIKSLYDETPVRQGRRFWHFGKDLDSVRRENATYLDRCDFVAAYFVVS